MRPLAYGLIVFFGSGILWVYFSVIAGAESAFGGGTTMMPYVYMFGLLFFFSLPATVIAEVIRWRRLKKQQREGSQG